MFFSKILKYSRLLPFSGFPRCQCVYSHRRCSRTGRVQKNHKILRKKHNNCILEAACIYVYVFHLFSNLSTFPQKHKQSYYTGCFREVAILPSKEKVDSQGSFFFTHACIRLLTDHLAGDKQGTGSRFWERENKIL